MANMGITETQATAQQLVASIVQETLKQRAFLLPTISNYSGFAPAGASQVSIPRRTQFSAADKAENVALTGQTITFASDVITLDKHKTVYALLEDFAAVEANVAVRAEIIQEMAAELALQVDKDILTELRLASAAAPDHIIQFANTPTDTAQRTDVLEARRLLNAAVVPMDNRFLLVSPDQEKSLLNIDEFISADKYGSPQGLREGELGRVHGFTVIMHTEVAAAEMIAYHQSAVGYASQVEPRFETDRKLAEVAEEFLIQMKYGVEVLDGGKRQVVFNATGA